MAFRPATQAGIALAFVATAGPLGVLLAGFGWTGIAAWSTRASRASAPGRPGAAP